MRKEPESNSMKAIIATLWFKSESQQLLKQHYVERKVNKTFADEF